MHQNQPILIKTLTFAVAEGLDPFKENMRRLILDFGKYHEKRPFFRSLPSMKTFTALRIMHLSQAVVGDLWTLNEGVRRSLTEMLPESLEELFIHKFDEKSTRAVLDLATQVSAGRFPNLKLVRVIGDVPIGHIRGSTFLQFANALDAAQSSDDDDDDDNEDDFYSTVVDLQSNSLQPVAAGEDQGVPENSDPDSTLDERIPHQMEWDEFKSHCYMDNVFRSSITRHVQESSGLSLRTAFNTVRLRRNVRMLFWKANVKFECVGIVIEGSVDGQTHTEYVSTPM